MTTTQPGIDMGTAALELAALGWPVLPLCWPADDGSCGCGGGHTGRDIGKAPYGKFAPHGVKSATIDDATVRTWWKLKPLANVGIAIEPAKLFVVAPDSPEWLTAFGQLGLPPTAIVKSGGGEGHWHYYYARPPGCPIHRLCRPDEYDILTNGYVVAPPSLHRSGERYRWEFAPQDVMPLAPAPDWIVEMLADATPTSAVAPAPPDPDQPPVRLYGRALKWWRGEEFAPKPDGTVDRSETLWAIAKDLAHAGATTSTIAAALANRDRKLGYEKYSRRRDGGTGAYQETAERATREADTEALPAPSAPYVNGTAPVTIATALPQIDASVHDLKLTSEYAWMAIMLANNPPELFQYGAIIARLIRDANGLPTLQELTIDRLRFHLARVAEWFTYKKDPSGPIRQPAKPPLDVVRDMLADPKLRLPVLSRIVEAPVFAPSGELCTQPGYHTSSQTYFAPNGALDIPPVNSDPSSADMQRAKALVFDDLFCDFPFKGDADRAHAVCLFLLPFARDLIAGPTPNHLIEASSPGSGKGLLGEVALYPAIGRAIGIVPPVNDDEEWRKQITTQLKDARPVIFIDNVVKPFTSAALAAAWTSAFWDDRLLGRNESIRLPIRCVWVTTANNAAISTEIIRRSVRIRLVPDTETPWMRLSAEFKHPELRRWVDENRGDLIWAGLTLIQSWIAAGRPRAQSQPLGSYEAWSFVLGGILEHAGIPGFLGNLDEFYEAADVEGAQWRDLTDAWWEEFGPKKVGVAELFEIALKVDRFELTGKTERAQRISFGMQLERQRDRVINDRRITFGGISHKSRLWQLVPRHEEGEKGELGNLGELSQPYAYTKSSSKYIRQGKSSPCSPSSPPREPQVGDLVRLLNAKGEIQDPDPWTIAGFDAMSGRRYARFDRPGEQPFWWDIDQLEYVEPP